MAVIRVEHLKKEFEYYKKGTGLQGSLHNLFHREMLKKEDGTTPYTLKTADYDEKQTLYYHKYRRGYVFKKSFIVPGEGETKRTVSLTYGGTNALSTYNVIVEFADKAA